MPVTGGKAGSLRSLSGTVFHVGNSASFHGNFIGTVRICRGKRTGLDMRSELRDYIVLPTSLPLDCGYHITNITIDHDKFGISAFLVAVSG